MSWEDRLFDTAQSGESLIQKIDALLEQQRVGWPAFREGEAYLERIKSKTFSQGQSRIIVQSNPGRRTSTLARVDPASISRRACFLCEEHMPAGERGVGFNDLVILPNPHPILPLHLTIPGREHKPQKLAGRIGDMLRLAKALGPGLLVFYNGARCGASAPDHFHFQACSRSGVSLLDELYVIGRKDATYALASFGRRMLICDDSDAYRVSRLVQHTLEVLSRFNQDTDEPLINIVTHFCDRRYLTILFPRARHRPACYFAKGDSQISVSPAALEMAGILVVADPDHFDRLDQETAASIYAEVSLDDTLFGKLVEAVT